MQGQQLPGHLGSHPAVPAHLRALPPRVQQDVQNRLRHCKAPHDPRAGGQPQGNVQNACKLPRPLCGELPRPDLSASVQALALTDGSGQGRGSARDSCIAEQSPAAMDLGESLASQNGDEAPKVQPWSSAQEGLVTGSSAIPGPGSGSGPGSSGMAQTASGSVSAFGSVSALACSAGSLLALLFLGWSAHSEQLVTLGYSPRHKSISQRKRLHAALQELLCMSPVPNASCGLAGQKICRHENTADLALPGWLQWRASDPHHRPQPPESPSSQKSVHAAHPRSWAPVHDPAQHLKLRTWLDSQDLACSLVSMHT